MYWGMRSERRIAQRRIVTRDAFITVSVEQSDLIVRPDSLAQIIEEFNYCHRLLRRPPGIDEQFESLRQTGRLMMFHADSFILRFLDLAAACS